MQTGFLRGLRFHLCSNDVAVAPGVEKIASCDPTSNVLHTPHAGVLSARLGGLWWPVQPSIAFPVPPDVEREVGAGCVTSTGPGDSPSKASH